MSSWRPSSRPHKPYLVRPPQGSYVSGPLTAYHGCHVTSLSPQSRQKICPNPLHKTENQSSVRSVTCLRPNTKRRKKTGGNVLTTISSPYKVACQSQQLVYIVSAMHSWFCPGVGLTITRLKTSLRGWTLPPEIRVCSWP